MTTDVLDKKESFIKSELKKYNVTDASIAKLSEQSMKLKVKNVNDQKGYAIVKMARMEIKNKRVAVEKTRKELKSESLSFGKTVDTEAKRITTLLRPIEDHLISQEKIIEDEKERIETEKAEKEKLRIKGRIDRLLLFGATFNGCEYVFDALSISHDDVVGRSDEEFDKFVDALADALESKEVEEAKAREEQEKIKAEQKAEAERLETIRKEQEKKEAKIKTEQERVRKEQEEREAKIKAEIDTREAKIKAEQEKIDAEKRAIAEQKEKAERQEEENDKFERAKEEAAKQARIEAEDQAQRELEEKEKKEKQARKNEELRLAMLPDKEKLVAFAERLMAVPTPSLSHEPSHKILSNAKNHLKEACNILMETGAQ